MHQFSLEQKVEVLCQRITLIENENSELKLQVKELKQDIDNLKATKTNIQSMHLTKNNHMSTKVIYSGSTNSITDKTSKVI
jgi:phage shock protein A